VRLLSHAFLPTAHQRGDLAILHEEPFVKRFSEES
jgi:hypothetical protein